MQHALLVLLFPEVRTPVFLQFALLWVNWWATTWVRWRVVRCWSPSSSYRVWFLLISMRSNSRKCGIVFIIRVKTRVFYKFFFHSRFEKTKETSPCAQCGLKCCICCFYCLEKFIRFMNHNAYTVVAIEGTHFCNAARIVSSRNKEVT